MRLKNGYYQETYFIAHNIYRIIKTRKLTLDKASKLLGYKTRQEMYYLTKKKMDCYWTLEELEDISKKLNTTVKALCYGLEDLYVLADINKQDKKENKEIVKVKRKSVAKTTENDISNIEKDLGIDLSDIKELI